jgi:hypothetical protein
LNSLSVRLIISLGAMLSLANKLVSVGLSMGVSR